MTTGSLSLTQLKRSTLLFNRCGDLSPHRPQRGPVSDFFIVRTQACSPAAKPLDENQYLPIFKCAGSIESDGFFTEKFRFFRKIPKSISAGPCQILLPNGKAGSGTERRSSAASSLRKGRLFERTVSFVVNPQGLKTWPGLSNGLFRQAGYISRALWLPAAAPFRRTGCASAAHTCRWRFESASAGNTGGVPPARLCRRETGPSASGFPRSGPAAGTPRPPLPAGRPG